MYDANDREVAGLNFNSVFSFSSTLYPTYNKVGRKQTNVSSIFRSPFPVEIWRHWPSSDALLYRKC